MIGRSYSGLLLCLFAIWLAVALISRIVSAQQPPPVTVAQAEATQPGVPPAPVPPSETFGWSITLGLLANAIMRKMKDSPRVAWIKDGAGSINVALSGFMAFLASAGLHTEFDQATWGFVISGSLMGMLHFTGDWIKQWALQQWVFNTGKT